MHQAYSIAYLRKTETDMEKYELELQFAHQNAQP